MKSIEEILKSTALPGIKERIVLATINAAAKGKKIKNKKGAPPSGVVVFQHNNLVEANYMLSLQEKRIILWLISQIQHSDDDFKKHSISTDALCNMIGIETDYSYIHKVIKKLMMKTVSIEKLHENSITTLHWVDYAKYWIKEGIIELSFHPEMKPFLLELKNQFTAISLSDLMQFSSIYAVRFYELLKQYENIGERIIEVDTIRRNCGIGTKLKQYKEFKNHVLLIAQREINSKSDIEFTFEEIKTGRKFTKIKFKICKNKTRLKQIPALQEIKRRLPIVHILEEFGLSKRIIANIIGNNSEENIMDAVKAVEIQLQRGNVKNPKAMLLKAIKGNWHPEKYTPNQK